MHALRDALKREANVVNLKPIEPPTIEVRIGIVKLQGFEHH
jgi:hypothetical protein